MAISSEKQTELLKVIVGLFNATPGGSNLTDLATAVENGMTISQVADFLAAHPLFTNGVMAGRVTTESQVAVLMKNFGLTVGNADPESADAQAEEYFTNRIIAGDGFGQIVYDAISFLSRDDLPTGFSGTAVLLSKKVAVSEYFSSQSGSSGLSLEDLQKVLSAVTVDSDVSTPEAIERIIASGSDSVIPEITAPAAPFEYAENSDGGIILGTVVATDNVAVAGFEIVSGNESGFFAIDASGNITLTVTGADSVANDFETEPNSFTLGVRAIDAAGNRSATVEVVLNEQDVDDTAPVLTEQVLAGNRAIMTFDEVLDSASVPAGSSFTVSDNGTNIAVSAVSISGNFVTLTLAVTPTGTVAVSYAPPATSTLRDAAGNSVAAFSDQTLGIDSTAPTLVSSSPADNATGVAAGDNLVLTFSEAVQAGTGNIVITNAADATDTRTIAVTDTTQVTFSGATVTINPTADLRASANYNVQIAATAITDPSGNAFAGIANSTTLNFGTAAPVVTTIALTTGVDTVSGTSANEFIDGSLFLSGGTFVNTLNNADSINGGGGSNTLFAQFTTGSAVTPAAVNNIQTINVENTGAGASTLTLSNGDGAVTTVRSANNVGGMTVAAIQSAPTTFDLSSTAAAFTATMANAALTGASDTATLALNNVTGAAAMTLGTVAVGSGYETIGITSNGTVANSITLDDGLATSLATVNIAGANNLTLALTPTTVTTVNATGYSGELTLTVAAANGQNMTITGGSGNDVINMNGTYTSSDVINGGNGSDRLTLTNAEAIAATTTQSNVSGIEVIGLSDGLSGTVAVNNFGAAGLRFGAAMAGAGTVNYAAGTNSLDLQTFGSGGFALTTNTAGTATNDVLNVTMGSTAAGNAFGAGAVTINGAETVNLLSQGGANSFGAGFTITDTAANQSLIITGNQAITFTGAVRADAIDASGMTSAATLTLTGGTGTTATTITGTANADTLNGSTAGDIINGGAGNDTIANVLTGTAATAGDVLTGGAGFDTFILRGDVASAAIPTAYNSAANVTDFTVGSSATTTDILQLSATIGNYSGGSAFFAGVAAAAAGATAIQSVAQNAAAAAVIAGVDLIKLTTGVATTGLTVQTAFNAAIGTGTVTGLVAGDDIFVSFYDTTNSKMVVGLVDATAGTNTVVETGDTITLIGTIDMSAADFASFNANNLSIIAA